MHDVLVFEDGVLGKNALNIAAKCCTRPVILSSQIAEIENDGDVVPDGETCHGTSRGGNLGRCVGSGNATLNDLHRVASVQHGDITEVEGDGMDLEEDIVRAKFAR